MLKKLWGMIYSVLRLIALAFLVYAFAQALPFDLLALAFAGDALAYLEIAAAIWLAAQVTRVRWVAAFARFAVRRTVRRARIRARRVVRRLARPRPSSSDDGRPAPALAWA